MPNQAMAEETISAALRSAWTDLTRPIIEWPNVDRPEGEPDPREGVDPWVALDILHRGSEQATLGPRGIGQRLFTRDGQLVVRVFVPAGKRGLTDATALAMAASDAYEGRTLDGVRFYRVGTKTVGRDGAWFQVNVTADFEFDEAK